MRLPRNIQLKIDQALVLVKKDFKVKYDSTALGMLWSILTPLAMSAIYWLVFGKVMNLAADSGGSFALYIVTGTFLWQYFSSVVMQNANVLASNASLLKKTAFDRRLLVWGVYFTETLHFLLTIPLITCFALLSGVRGNPLETAANAIVAMAALMWFSVGAGYFFAALNLILRDSRRILEVVFRIWFYATPVFIPRGRIPPQYSFVYDWNPMAAILDIWRDAFYAPAFHPEAYAPVLAVSVAVFLAGRWFFAAHEPRFAEKM